MRVRLLEPLKISSKGSREKIIRNHSRKKSKVPPSLPSGLPFAPTTPVSPGGGRRGARRERGGSPGPAVKIPQRHSSFEDCIRLIKMWTAVVNCLLRSKVYQDCPRVSLLIQKSRNIITRSSPLQYSAGVVQAAQPFNMNARIQKVEALDANHFVSRKLPLEDLDVEIGVKDITLTDRKKVYIIWPNEHTSEFEAEWLKKRCFSEQARAKMREELFVPEHEYWGSDLQFPEMSFEDVLSSDESAYTWLSTLKKVGIVMLTGAATRQGELVKLGKRIGFLRLTFYGPTWQVQDKMDANNVAYTTGKLNFHTDYPVLQHPPGVQFLHCIKQTTAGGESEVVDGFHVSRKLKQQNPQAFQILSSTLVDFTDVGVDYCDFSMQSKQKIIQINDRGEMDRINYNNATRDTVFDISAEKVQPFYAALKEFVNLLNSTEHKVTYKMKPGDIVTFDNWRVLHGRGSYQSEKEIARHLEDQLLSSFGSASRLHSCL
ncbi:gamma-butyrobetaine dioxygenase isoform A [Alligator mississippiensis]|uniref:Gamma-butyrobetaine dioxygenase isoform A n=1 Tax=Alligator mississippiensis TaxID=8496 RepID=A0A151MBP8_ALLMI|nr:gamma-butyrobetaine dioxygenase isoform A [Alligator mississippiensis]